MRIVIEVIPHEQQRYPTVGDWQWLNEDKDNLKISISDMGDWRYNILVAMHELHEVLLCKDRHIEQDVVDKFDMLFEANRKEGNVDEPGDDPTAPYYKEHQFATCLERLMALELRVNWRDYDETVNNL